MPDPAVSITFADGLVLSDAMAFSSTVMINILLCVCTLALEMFKQDYFDGFMQDCSNSSALAIELLQSYAKPLISNSSIYLYQTTVYVCRLLVQQL